MVFWKNVLFLKDKKITGKTVIIEKTHTNQDNREYDHQTNKKNPNGDINSHE